MRFKGFHNSKLLTSKLRNNDEEQIRFKGLRNPKLLSILKERKKADEF